MLKTIYLELLWRKEQFLLRKLSELPDTVRRGRYHIGGEYNPAVSGCTGLELRGSDGDRYRARRKESEDPGQESG